jgi:lipid-binding SYLF domain-containing protein
VTVNGSTVRTDLDANQRFYGKRLNGADLVLSNSTIEASTPVPEWMQTLSRHIPR